MILHISLFAIFCLTGCDSEGYNEDSKMIENEMKEEQKNTYNVSLFLEKRFSSSQGMAIFNDMIFVLNAGGRCDVYDYITKQFIISFMIGSSGKYNHCNCANWGIEYPQGSVYPLFYVTDGLPGSPTEWHCKVEKVNKKDTQLYSECVQTIILDASSFEDYGYLKPWGCPQWLVDRERGYLWVWSAKLRTLPSTTGDFSNNIYHATKFRIPKLSEGEVVTLDASDVLDQIQFKFDAYSTQGGCMHDGKIIYSYGFGDTTSPSKIRVYDTDKKVISSTLDFEGQLDVEFEDVEFYHNKLYLNTSSKYLYEIKIGE